MVAVPALGQTPETLPAIIDAARSALAGARTSAEVLEARDMAAAAYDAASRFTRRKAAFDHMTALAMRMQAQALRIEARAKERLADEYDAAQDRGEVARLGWQSGVDKSNTTTAADLGLRRDQIHEARRLRDAERAEPGAIDRAIDERLARGEPPTRAALKRDLGLARPVPPSPPDDDTMMRQVVPELVRRLRGNPLTEFEEPGGAVFDHTVEVLRGLPAPELEALRRAARSLSLLVKELEDGGL